MANQLGRHFVLFTLGELCDMYERQFTVVHVRSIDFREPYLSIVVLERREDGDEVSD